MAFRAVTGFAAALLLATAPALAEPMEHSPRPLLNPRMALADAAAAVALPGPALIGPERPAVPAADQPQQAQAEALPRAPVNPRLGVLSRSTSNQPEPDAPAQPRALAFTDLPELGDMLPASMPSPEGPQPGGSLAGGPLVGGSPAVSPGPSAASENTVAAAPPVIGPIMPAVQPAGKRPKSRPEGFTAKVTALQAEEAKRAETAAAAILTTSLRPKQKPAGIVQLASAPVKKSAPKSVPEPVSQPVPEKGSSKSKKKEPVSAKGSVCGVAAIKGEKIAPITSKVQGCGLSDGVRVTSVSGVRLSMAATIDCTTAKALNTWVERVAQPAYGSQIVELQIAGHYVCRPRNNKKGAKVSEHGRGKAVDISGFRLASGKVIKVLGGFDKVMRQAHRGACGIFGTTLGPGSDGYHEDHLHFDTASHRSGSYCR